MSKLVIRVELLRGVFEGSDSDSPDQPEWPPSWMRVFSALVDRADLDEEASVLEALEQLPPPQIAATKAHLARRAAFVPTNEGHPKRSGKPVHTTTLLHRVNGERHWPRAVPVSPTVEYRWSESQFGDANRSALAAIARRIPYIGRSSSPAIVSVHASPKQGADFSTLEPLMGSNTDRFAIVSRSRIPTDGALTALVRIHEAKLDGKGADPWSVGTWIEYGVESDPSIEVVDGPYDQMVVLRYDGPRLDGRNTAPLMRYVKKALMSRVGDPPIPELHGHELGTDRISLVGLVDVGYPRSDGHLLGLAVCLPEMDRGPLTRVASSLPAMGETFKVNGGRLGVAAFERTAPAESLRLPWGLRARRWMGPSTVWTTALPMVADRFLEPGDSVSECVTRMVKYAGLPGLKTLHAWNTEPLLHGALRLRSRDTLRRPGDRAVRPFFHATFELTQPVVGPVIVGSMRHYGLGLCVPDSIEQPDE